jgi:hypothetical protein
VLKTKVKVRDELKRVRQGTKSAAITNLNQAGAYVRGIAKRSIKVAADASAPGKPPHSRKGRLKKSIRFAVEQERQRAVVGPPASEVGKIGRTHEFGGVEPPKKNKKRKANFKLEVGGFGPLKTADGKAVIVKLKTDRQVARAKETAQSLPEAQGGTARNKPRKYPARPFMGPALAHGRERLPKFWANSVKG